MNHDQINTAIRDMFMSLINDGHKKNPICGITLGLHKNPQFEGFLKGTNLGIKPLSRIIEGLGYELSLVPVKKDDEATLKQVETIGAEFISSAKKELLEYLETHKSTTPTTGKTPDIFRNTIDDLLSQIED